MIVALQPDFLILRGGGEASHPLRRLAEERNIRIYDDAVETLDELYKTIGDLGQLLDRREQAERMIRQIHDELATVRDSRQGRPRPRVLFTLGGPVGLSSIFTVGRDTFVNELIELVGGENIFGGHATRYPNVSLEEVVGRNPQVIIESMPGEPIDDARRKELWQRWESLDQIEAVRTGRVYFVSEEYLTVPSQRVTLSAGKLAELIHAEPASRE
jgi:iron complex transport system substrate-binding protein